MRLPPFALIAAAALVAIATSEGTAQSDCRVDGDPAAQIVGCTKVIADASITRADRGVAYLYRCQAHDLLDQGEQAVPDCLTAADLNPSDASIYNSLNIVYRKLDRLAESLAAADRAVELDAREGAHFAGRAATLCRMGRYEESLADRLRAIELGYLGVERVQRFLKDNGFYDGEIDGKAGTGTEAGLKAWTENGC